MFTSWQLNKMFEAVGRANLVPPAVVLTIQTVDSMMNLLIGFQGIFVLRKSKLINRPRCLQRNNNINLIITHGIFLFIAFFGVI